MPEDHPLGLFLHVEEVHGATDLAVVALFSFLDAREVRLQVRFRSPSRAVDPLKHRVAMIAPPIGPGQLGQLEGFAHVLG